ncbi:ATP-binding protein [Actinoplanes oblitus]|uniref:ATP-binding protein n=1 Tax=Actinoplanes oblitus TaxID=3040509 RepID=A0ABY8W414_9ACTN|nr:ATP-binding protein [Actinoplanes oblitus]WIM92560.1 ATP-binding protein [Actinoplanes oblitus]
MTVPIHPAAAGPSRRAHPAQPPYLVTTATGRRGIAVGVTADASTSVVEMTVHGQWSPDLGSQVTGVLHLCLAGPVATIIIDLHHLADQHGLSRQFWMTTVRAARLRPVPVQIVLCLPAETMLSYRLRHHDVHRPPIFTTLPDARRATSVRPPHSHRLQVRLRPEPISVPAARGLVVRACDAWRLPLMRRDAGLIMSELTTNAVQHAGTDLVVTVSRRDQLLHLAVRDADTRYPHLDHPAGQGGTGALSERGRGLLLVHATADAWGVLPARGGKVVWATLSPPAGLSSPRRGSGEVSWSPSGSARCHQA